MKERPINFSAPMVKALLAGTKTQTRRHLKPLPIPEISEIEEIPATDPYLGCVVSGHSGVWEDVHSCDLRWKCPFGVPGDRLWVREDHHITLRDARSVAVKYMADGEVVPEITIGPRERAMFMGRKRPAATTRGRFMWRCLSRITLEVVSVRVERLQVITEANAVAEGVKAEWSIPMNLIVQKGGGTCEITDDYIHGVPKPGETWMGREVTHVERTQSEQYQTAKESYRLLWEKLNGAGSWSLNPWVWVVEFRRVEK